MKEEIQAEALTRNLEGFSRFFRIITSRCGGFLDISKFSSQAEIERTSAKRYFEILIDTLVLSSVEAFTKSERLRLVQHPRYYFFDVGVLNGALSNFEVSADRIGKLFEHLCLQLLYSEFKSMDKEVRISVYRTAAGAEVDFIIEHGKSVVACEVKATRKLGSEDFNGLESDLEEIAGRIFEIKSATSIVVIDLPFLRGRWICPIFYLACLDPIENLIEFRFTFAETSLSRA